MAGMSMRKLAKRTGYSVGHISRIVRGERNPSLESATRLAAAMGVTLDEFQKAVAGGKLDKLLTKAADPVE